MSVCRIGGTPFSPASNVTGGKKPKAKETAQSAALTRSAYDTAGIHSNPLAVMPRMSTVEGQSARHLRGEAMEKLLRDAAPELDAFFTAAYGFDGDANKNARMEEQDVF